MASTLRPTPSPASSSTDKDLPTAAYVMIGVGVYLFLVLLFIIIRRCLKVGCVVLQWGHKTYLYVIYFIIIIKINEHTRFSMEC